MHSTISAGLTPSVMMTRPSASPANVRLFMVALVIDAFQDDCLYVATKNTHKLAKTVSPRWGTQNRHHHNHRFCSMHGISQTSTKAHARRAFSA